MKINIISSSSEGNCIVIDDCIVIDAGITMKKFKEHYEFPEDMKVFLVTHKHQDHYQAPLVREFLKKGVKGLLPKGAIENLMLEGKDNVMDRILTGQVDEITNEYTLQFEVQDKKYKLTTYAQRHHDLVNYAVVLETVCRFAGKTHRERLLYATDLDTLEPTLEGVGLMHLGNFDYILLEGNYDEYYLREYLEDLLDKVDTKNENIKSFTNDELEVWVRRNYREFPKEVARDLFRAIQNRRHLSKQQARAYVRKHLRYGGEYYELHRSSQFYEAPNDWYIPESKVEKEKDQDYERNLDA